MALNVKKIIGPIINLVGFIVAVVGYLKPWIVITDEEVARAAGLSPTYNGFDIGGGILLAFLLILLALILGLVGIKKPGLQIAAGILALLALIIIYGNKVNAEQYLKYLEATYPELAGLLKLGSGINVAMAGAGIQMVGGFAGYALGRK